MHLLYPIPNFEGYYVTKNGIIYSARKSSNPKIMIPKTDKDGYLYLGIYNEEGIRKWKRVHTLVAETFIPNPNNFPMINHINGIRDDNRHSNLEWCNNSQNQLHSFHVLGRKGECYNRKPIKLTHKDTGETFKFESLTECADFIGMTVIHLVRLLNKKNDISKSRKLRHYNIQMM